MTILDLIAERKYGQGPVLFDMHVHSCYSSDSALPVNTIVRSYIQYGILPLVCDHNTIAGSGKVYAGLRERDAGIPCILAEEIMTRDGEIIGLFLTEPVRPFLSAEETLDTIRDQGALSLIPHPFCSYRTSAIKRDALDRNIGRIDMVEGFNARVIRDDENILAQRYAAQYKKPVSAGSDAHTFVELARNFVAIEPFSSPGELLRNLRHARVHFRKIPASIHYVTRAIRFAKQNSLV